MLIGSIRLIRVKQKFLISQVITDINNGRLALRGHMNNQNIIFKHFGGLIMSSNKQ